jgi:hypothetical protein
MGMSRLALDLVRSLRRRVEPGAAGSDAVQPASISMNSNLFRAEKSM